MKRAALALCAALIATAPLVAETSVTAEQAAALAIAHNLSLKRSKIDVDAAKRAADRSWNSALPSLSLSSGTARSTTTETWSVYGTVSASLTLSPSLVKNIEKARLSYTSGLLTYEVASRDLELSVRKAFFSLLLAKENISLIEQNIATAQKQYEQTVANFKAGLVPELDVLSAQVTLENLRPTLASAKVSYDSAIGQFKQLLGIPQDEELILSGTLNEAAALSAIDTSLAVGESPNVATIKNSLDLAQAAKAVLASSAYLPALSLAWTYRPTYTPATETITDQGSFSATLSLSLSGFLPWSSTRENLDEADDAIKKLELQLAEVKVTADLTAKNLLNQIEQALAALKALRLNVELAQKSYDLTADAYKKGAKDLLSLQSADDALRQAKVETLKEAYTLISDVLDLEYATGVPFGTLGR